MPTIAHMPLWIRQLNTFLSWLQAFFTDYKLVSTSSPKSSIIPMVGQKQGKNDY